MMGNPLTKPSFKLQFAHSPQPRGKGQIIPESTLEGLKVAVNGIFSNRFENNSITTTITSGDGEKTYFVFPLCSEAELEGVLGGDC